VADVWGQDYVPDVAMQKMRKGRRKKKRFRNEIDDMEKGYGNDMHGSGDFNQMKNKVHCSVYHGEGHTMNRHKQGPKRNPRARAAVERSHRRTPTVIVEVTHMSNIEKLFFMLLCTTIIFCTRN
jgi:ribonuclease PH